MILKRIFNILTLVFVSINLFSQSTNTKKIEIKSVSFSLETSFSLSCSDFEKLIASKIKVREIYNVDTISDFKKLVNKTKKSDEKTEIDVRAKIYIYSSAGSPTIVCMDRFGNIILNNQLIKKNENLVKLIKSCLPEGTL